MYYQEKQLLFSPSDLNTFLESDFASWMARFELECRHLGCEPHLSLTSLGLPGIIEAKRDELTEEIASIQKHGQTHEAQWLGSLKKKGQQVVDIGKIPRETAEKETLAAMKAGADIVYQAYLRTPPFAGHADFLIRTEGKSKLGFWHYEVADTKLARSTKAYFLLQLCCYADMLEKIQGVRPRSIRVILGDKSEAVFPTDAFYHYYQSLRGSFEQFHGSFDSKVSQIKALVGTDACISTRRMHRVGRTSLTFWKTSQF